MINFFRTMIPLCCHGTACVIKEKEVNIDNMHQVLNTNEHNKRSSIYESNFTTSNSHIERKGSHSPSVNRAIISRHTQSQPNITSSDIDSVINHSQSNIINNFNHYYQELNPDTHKDYNINNTQLITLEDIEGDLLFNKKLFVDAYGLRNGLRSRKDNVAFFGSISHYKRKVINDFVLNLDEEIVMSSKVKIFFAICYDYHINKFFFKNILPIDFYSLNQLNISFIPFYSLPNKDMKLHHKNLVLYGKANNLIYVDIMKDQSLKLEIISKGHNVIENLFNYSLANTPILIGERGIVNKENKVIAEIYYNIIIGVWMIKDKNQTDNCIWIACDKKIEIKETIRIKFNKEILEMSISESN